MSTVTSFEDFDVKINLGNFTGEMCEENSRGAYDRSGGLLVGGSDN
jgi:hypothetical protein